MKVSSPALRSRDDWVEKILQGPSEDVNGGVQLHDSVLSFLGEVRVEGLVGLVVDGLPCGGQEFVEGGEGTKSKGGGLGGRESASDGERALPVGHVEVGEAG